VTDNPATMKELGYQGAIPLILVDTAGSAVTLGGAPTTAPAGANPAAQKFLGFSGALAAVIVDGAGVPVDLDSFFATDLDLEDLTLRVDALDLVATDHEDRLGVIEAWDASDLPYDNSGSGLTATTVQEAIDELAVPRREVLASSRTYYVRTDGSNSNNGLTNSSGGAFLTVQHALDVVYGTLDLFGYGVTVQVGAGTYSEAVAVETPQVGAGNITLTGDTTTPANCTINSGGQPSIRASNGARLLIAGIKVTAPSGQAGWHAEMGGIIESAGKNEVGAVAAHHLLADGPSTIRMTHEMVISGGCAGGHLNAGNNSFIYIQGGSWTISGTPTVGAFAQASNGAAVYAFANSFSGAINGQRYNASMNGVIQTNGGGANYFPGSVAGTTATGGQYA
jgi:hypothetical protein